MIARGMSLRTLHRLVAALVREGLATGVSEGRRLVVKTPGCTAHVMFRGRNPAWPHPSEIRGGLRLGRRVIQDPVEYLSLCRLDWPWESINALSTRLRNCVEHAALSEVFRRKTPSPGDNALAWEAAQVGGDPLHVLHRARTGITMPHAYLWAPEMGGFTDLCFHRGPVQATGPFHDLLSDWLPEPDVLPVHPAQAIARGHDPGEIERPLPVEAMRWAGVPLQVQEERQQYGQVCFHGATIRGSFGEDRRRAWSQQDFRSVCPDGLPYTLVLSLPARCPDERPLGDLTEVLERSQRLRDALGDRIVPELATGFVYALGCIVRERATGIPLASLEERDDEGAPVARRLGGDAAWFHRHTQQLMDALLPPLADGIVLGVGRQDVLVGPDGVRVRNLGATGGSHWRVFNTLIGHLDNLRRVLALPPLDLEPELRARLPASIANDWMADRVPMHCVVRSELEGRPVQRLGFNPLRG